jgi:uncharacterized membrane protein YbhN (UPF0104 family)
VFALRIALEVAAVGAVVYFFVHEAHRFRGFGATLAGLQWSWVLLALVAELASIPPLAEAQRIVLRAGGTDADRIQMNLLTLASNAISLSVPAGVAVAEGYTFTIYRRFGADPATAAWAELSSGAIAFAALAAVALAGAVIAGGGAERVLVPTLSVVVAGAVGAAAIFRRPRLLIRAVDWLREAIAGHLGPTITRWATIVQDKVRSLVDVRPPMSVWLEAYALSAVNWLADCVCLALCFRAVGAPIPWGVVLLAFAGSKVVTTVGITPGGIGVVEGGLIATFVAYGARGADAGAAVLVYRALTLVGLVGLGWIVVAYLAAQGRKEEARARA